MILNTWLYEKCFNSILTELQNLQLGQVTETTKRAHLIVREVQFAKVWARALIEHVFEVAQFAI